MDGWRALLARARREGFFAGVDPDKFPQDFAALARYHTAIKELGPRYPLPQASSLDTLYAFLAETQGRYAVQWHGLTGRSEEHTSELQSLMRISYAVFFLKKKKIH